tara:strand:+ start:3469 stop:6588 length:3120 start_codon:yes stop_codon:yes gene_type:complete
MKIEFKKIKVKEHIFNKVNGYDLDTKEIVNDEYQIYLCENKKHLIQLLFNEDNIHKKIAISTTHKSVGIDLLKSFVCKFYDKELNLLPEFINEVVGFICGEGLYIYNCNEPTKSILSRSFFINQYSKEDTSKTDIDKVDDDYLQIGMCNSKLIQLEGDNKFNKIVKKYGVELMREKQTKDEDYTEIDTIKQNFLEDYENSIVNVWKITKWIRSPSVIAGLSQNKKYFDRQFHFCCSQSVICEENLQMWFRERRTYDKQIYFCFSDNIQPYKPLYSNEMIGKFMDGSINTTKNNKKFVNTIDYDSKLHTEPELMELLKLNETIDINCRKSYTQIFMDLLFKHTFRLDTNIKLLRYVEPKKDKENKEPKEDKENSVEYQIEQRNMIELQNFINTELIDTIDTEYLHMINKAIYNQEPVSMYWRQIHKKYKSLNYYMKFSPLIISFWLNSVNENSNYTLNYHMETLQSNKNQITDTDTIHKIEQYEKLLTSQVIKDLDLNYKLKYYTKINDTEFIKELQIHKSGGEFSSKYRKIKNIIKLQTDMEIDEDVEISNKTKLQTKEQIDKSQTIILNTLLEFLHIDIMDTDKPIIKRYIIESNDKIDIIGLRNELLTDKNCIEIDGKQISFINWINTTLINHYNTNYKDSNKTIYKKKLSPETDILVITKIIKSYLLKINLVFDYECNNTNQTKLYKNTQFTITPDKKIDINYKSIIPELNIMNTTIIERSKDKTGIITDHIVKQPKQNSYYVDGIITKQPKTINLDYDCNVIYRDNYKLSAVNQPYIKYSIVGDKYITNINKSLTDTETIENLIDTPTPEEYRFIYRDCKKDYKVNDINILSTNRIKRNKQRKYIDTKLDKEVAYEIYTSYPDRKRIKRFYSKSYTKSINKMKLISNRINRLQKKPVEEFVINETLDKIFTTKYYSKIYTEDFKTNHMYRMNNLVNEIYNKVKEVRPVISLDINDYIYNVMNDLYNYEYNEPLDRNIYNYGVIEPEVDYGDSDGEISSDSEEEEEEEEIVNEEVVFKPVEEFSNQLEMKMKLMGW